MRTEHDIHWDAVCRIHHIIRLVDESYDAEEAGDMKKAEEIMAEAKHEKQMCFHLLKEWAMFKQHNDQWIYGLKDIIKK